MLYYICTYVFLLFVHCSPVTDGQLLGSRTDHAVSLSAEHLAYQPLKQEHGGAAL